MYAFIVTAVYIEALEADVCFVWPDWRHFIQRSHGLWTEDMETVVDRL